MQNVRNIPFLITIKIYLMKMSKTVKKGIFHILLVSAKSLGFSLQFILGAIQLQIFSSETIYSSISNFFCHLYIL